MGRSVLLTSKADVDRTIAEAEAIRAGKTPETAAQEAGPQPPTGDGTDPAASGEVPPSSPAPSPADVEPLATLCVVLTDMLFCRIFGPAGQMGEPLRTEAVKAWGTVLITYAPMIQQAGPWGALAGVYVAHGIGCAVSWQTSASASGSSADADPAKPRF